MKTFINWFVVTQINIQLLLNVIAIYRKNYNFEYLLLMES